MKKIIIALFVCGAPISAQAQENTFWCFELTHDPIGRNRICYSHFNYCERARTSADLETRPSNYCVPRQHVWFTQVTRSDTGQTFYLFFEKQRMCIRAQRIMTLPHEEESLFFIERECQRITHHDYWILRHGSTIH